jgi:hypothetical protein
MMTRKSLNQVYQEKYGTTWGLTDVQKCTFDYKAVFTKDLVRLLSSLTNNQEWIFGGTHPMNKLNQIVHAIRNELYLRKSEPKQIDKPVVEEPNFNTINYQSMVKDGNNHEYYRAKHMHEKNNFSSRSPRETEVNYNR